MNTKKLLNGKKILIVDDEPDVLESLAELLDICKTESASSFEDGRQKLQTQSYDMVILDIMGVQGFELLKVANSQGIPALMLTAKALKVESLKKSIEEGAAYFAPKEKMIDIELFVADIFEAIENKKNPWMNLLDRLGEFYDKRFQRSDWRGKEDVFLKKYMGGRK
jgi:DNA-binding response OmpR family regulator